METFKYSTVKYKLTRGSEEAAGYDIRALNDGKLVSGVNKISTGICISIPKGYYGQIHDRSSIASKGFYVSAGVIDSDYRGEVIVLINGPQDKEYEYKSGDRIAQIVLHKIYEGELEEVSQMDETLRGTGGFGSTGVN